MGTMGNNPNAYGEFPYPVPAGLAYVLRSDSFLHFTPLLLIGQPQWPVYMPACTQAAKVLEGNTYLGQDL